MGLDSGEREVRSVALHLLAFYSKSLTWVEEKFLYVLDHWAFILGYNINGYLTAALKCFLPWAWWLWWCDFARRQFCLTWQIFAMSEEHPDAEALAVLGSACDVGTVTVFAFYSHPWLVFFPSFLFPSPSLASFLLPVLILLACLLGAAGRPFPPGFELSLVFSVLLYWLSLGWVGVCSSAL